MLSAQSTVNNFTGQNALFTINEGSLTVQNALYFKRGVCVRACVRARVCVCECVRARASTCVCVFPRVCPRAHAMCMCVFVCVNARAFVCVSLCVQIVLCACLHNLYGVCSSIESVCSLCEWCVCLRARFFQCVCAWCISDMCVCAREHASEYALVSVRVPCVRALCLCRGGGGMRTRAFTH